MKIVYVGKHGKVGVSNDDEGAIVHALKQLGHSVHCINQGTMLSERDIRMIDGDFLLLNHWEDYRTIELFNMPKVFWGFDLIDYGPDRTTQWIDQLLEICTCGFLTDGEHVKHRNSDRLFWLCQGFDERESPQYVKRESGRVLFTGILHHDQRKEMHLRLTKKYGPNYAYYRGRYHGERLAVEIAKSSVVVGAPEPTFERYWSNRAYIVMGYGGLLLHRDCGLREQYEDGKDYVSYQTLDELIEKIDYYIEHEKEAEGIRHSGWVKTHANHTYRHRCEELIYTVRRFI